VLKDKKKWKNGLNIMWRDERIPVYYIADYDYFRNKYYKMSAWLK
jgi:hypothetical protein